MDNLIEEIIKFRIKGEELEFSDKQKAIDYLKIKDAKRELSDLCDFSEFCDGYDFLNDDFLNYMINHSKDIVNILNPVANINK